MSDNKPAMITTLIDDWKLWSAEAKKKLKLKYLPVDFDFARIDEYERYLSMSIDDQQAYVSDMSNDAVEFWISLETARVLYEDPLAKRDGSITDAKIARHPERYK